MVTNVESMSTTLIGPMGGPGLSVIKKNRSYAKLRK